MAIRAPDGANKSLSGEGDVDDNNCGSDHDGDADGSNVDDCYGGLKRMTGPLRGLSKSQNNYHDSMKSHWQMSKSHSVIILWIINPDQRLNTNCSSVSRYKLI